MSIATVKVTKLLIQIVKLSAFNFRISDFSLHHRLLTVPPLEGFVITTQHGVESILHSGICCSLMLNFSAFLSFMFHNYKENRSRSRHNVEGFFCRCTIFRLAKPAFFRYNENFTLVRDFYVAYFVIPEISKNN